MFTTFLNCSSTNCSSSFVKVKVFKEREKGPTKKKIKLTLSGLICATPLHIVVQNELSIDREDTLSNYQLREQKASFNILIL